MPDPTIVYTLPPRRETILARYSRNLKLAVTAAVFACIILPPAWMHGHKTETPGPSLLETLIKPLGDDKNMPVRETGNIQTDINAEALNNQDDRGVKLTPSPDARLSEDTAQGSLPRKGEDGAQPWRVYARPFNTADRRPRIAIVLTGLGLSREISDEAINNLPPTITLSFDGEGTVVGSWIARARQDGHEALLEIPMEPFDYPRSDPGPDALLTSLPNSDNLTRLYTVMRRASGYVGVASTSGSRFTTDPTKLTPILKVMHDRGLMVLDARTAPHSVVTDIARENAIPVATLTQRIDSDLSPDAIAAALNDLEKGAVLSGRAVGIAAATPVMLTQLQLWAKGLPQRGIALAPVSALVK